MSEETLRNFPPTSFQTPRLRLRAMERGDVADLFEAYASNTAAARYLQREAHHSPSQTETVAMKWGLENWSTDGKFAWTVLKRDRPRVIGLFLLEMRETDADIHFGYSPESWGNGYATEAGLIVMDWIKARSAIRQVTTVCDCEHTASLNVLAKLGLKRVELLPKHLFFPAMGMKRDCWLYSWERTEAESS